MLFARFTERPKPVVGVDPDRRVFRGETVTLTCHIQQTGDWEYSWYKDNKHVYSGQNYIISSVDPSHGGVYSCRGTQSRAPDYSQMSDGVTLTVSGESYSLNIESKYTEYVFKYYTTVLHVCRQRKVKSYLVLVVNEMLHRKYVLSPLMITLNLQ